jgi:hypothetical protein
MSKSGLFFQTKDASGRLYRVFAFGSTLAVQDTDGTGRPAWRAKVFDTPEDLKDHLRTIAGRMSDGSHQMDKMPRAMAISDQESEELAKGEMPERVKTTCYYYAKQKDDIAAKAASESDEDEGEDDE